MVILVILGVVVIFFLANAYRLDRSAEAKGMKYVPIKEKGWVRSRTRMVLVEKESADELLVEKLLEEQQALRTSRASYDPWRFLPGNIVRRRKR